MISDNINLSMVHFPISVLVSAQGCSLTSYLINASFHWNSDNAIKCTHVSTGKKPCDFVDLQQFTVRGQDITCFDFPGLVP